MNVKLTDLAELDARSARDWYESRREGLVKRFIAELSVAVENLELFPFAWQPLGENVRRYRLDRFPYGVYYVIDSDACVVFAIDHLRRRPRHWKDRLRTLRS